MMLVVDQVDIILRFIGYTKEEIDAMDEWEPIRKVNAFKEIVSAFIGSIFGGSNQSSPSGRGTVPFNNMPTDGSIKW